MLRRFIAATVLVLGWAGAECPAETLPALRSWITNVSVLSGLDSVGDSTTIGYVIGGTPTGEKQLLIRGVGPSLTPFGVTNALRDPKLQVFGGGSAVAENDNWQGDSAIGAAAARLGAFPFMSSASLDAALIATVPAGGNTVRFSAADGSIGNFLGEIYDLSSGATSSDASLRLVNVSVLKRIQSSLTVGFVIAGDAPKTVLVRAIGPALAVAPYNVGGPLPNPKLALYGSGQRRIADNDDWGSTALLTDASRATGAFALPANSRDAAVVTQLDPGSYTVVVSDVASVAGYVLVEVYEVPRALSASADATPFTLVALPDTQYYTKPGAPQNGELAMFTAQTDWIQGHREAENIVYVAHLGDISDDGDAGGTVAAATQWANAVNAMSRLETPISIPYGLAVGNHDEEPNGDPNGTTSRYNENFGISRFAGRPYYGGHYGTNNDNHYDLFSAAGRGYVVVYVKYDAANAHPEFTNWANGVVASHPDRQAILVTHYMAGAGADYSSLGAQGGRLLNALKPNSNLFLALGGHVSGVTSFRRDPAGPNNRQKVTTLVSDYQFEARGGAGYLRLYGFSPAYGYMTCRSYSPFLDQYRTDGQNEYTQSLAPRGPAEEAAVALSNNRIVVAAVLAKAGTEDTPERSSVAVSFQTTPKSNTWDSWTTLEGAAGFQHVDAIAFSDDRVAIAAVGLASDAWVSWQSTPGSLGQWRAWQQVPSTPLQQDGSKALSYVKLARLTDDRLVLVGWTDGGAVYVSQQTLAGGAFGAWTSLGGSGVRQGDVVRLSDNRLVIVAVVDGGSIMANVQQTAGGSWAGWSIVDGGGKSFTYAATVARADDTVALFATRPETPTQGVYASVSSAGAASWPTLAAVASGATGFARIHAVLQRDGRIALFGCSEHGVGYFSQQATPGGSFSAWKNVTATTRAEIGSIKGAALSDGTLGAFAHGAATVEYYAFQAERDGSWIITGGLPVSWAR